MSNRHHLSPMRHLAVLVSLIGIVALYASAAHSGAEQGPSKAPDKAAAALAAQGMYVGSDICAQCHADAKAGFAKHAHGSIQTAAEAKGQGYLCEGCHGPGSAHAEQGTPETGAALANTAKNGAGCLTCHGTRLSPTSWQRSEHHRKDVGCMACHGQKGQPHADIVRRPAADTCFLCHGEKRAAISLPSHHPIKEKRIACADCHDTHAPMGREIKRDVCVTCHAKQRGPFRFEHAAISGRLTDACLDCHQAHGAPNNRLLRLANRGLCLQCHADKATHRVGRLCWDCHDAVHGSNSSPQLFRE